MGMRSAPGREAVASLIITGLLLASAAHGARAQEPAFVPPPRTITDITAILDQQKPDPEAARKLRADADAAPPARADRAALARFYFGRSQARVLLGDTQAAVADAEKAVQQGRGVLELREFGLMRHAVAVHYRLMGEPKKALEVLQATARESTQGPAQGWLFITYRAMVEQYVALGDLRQAEVYVNRNQALFRQTRNWPPAVQTTYFRANFESEVEQSKATLSAARGQSREAELAFRRAAELRRTAIRARPDTPGLSPVNMMGQSLAVLVASEGLMKARQGRMAEGEADVRRALLDMLKAGGKYSVQVVGASAPLAELLVEQGRLAEAEKLTRTSLEIEDALGVDPQSQRAVTTLRRLENILNLQNRWSEAAEIHDRIEAATRNWEPARRDALTLQPAHILTLYRTGNVAAGLVIAERLLAQRRARFGERHSETAYARGTLAVGLMEAGRDAEAAREFKAAIALLATRGGKADGDDAIETSTRDRRKREIIEHYIALLSRSGQSDAAVESFALADQARGQSVQQALAASSSRAAASDPALAELVRKEQDLQKQIAAQVGLLNNLLASPPQQRDEKAVADLQAEIGKMQAVSAKARQDIGRRFPKYADLIDPKPPSADDTRMALRPNEALLSFYFGDRWSFVWAVPKDGPVRFARISGDTAEIEEKIKLLRQALEPDVTAIRDIPAFDVTVAHEIYERLLKPVEAGWKPAKHLIVVTNGTLGLLPLSLLPTAPKGAAPSSAAPPGDTLFSEYRDVAWLARSHSVAMVPSASALLALRQSPAGSAKREPLIGFGDPLFSRQQELEAPSSEVPIQVADASRGAALGRRAAVQTDGVDSAELALLPRLPDTAQELKAIAEALRVDPATALHLGKEANEARVKSSKLANYRIVAFATHGLAAGDLNGLNQPALALTAPDVAGVAGDGLLTMDEILALKLDADWVLLSACNTGAGANAGAEAASGLGRAFFYAGTRALLVTNWSVHSASARDLVSDLFRRQSADASLTRAEALRLAMMAMIDGPGYLDSAQKTLFTYGHPMFWAPYSIIGDGQ
jgi:CHAT domain-containing protein